MFDAPAHGLRVLLHLGVAKQPLQGPERLRPPLHLQVRLGHRLHRVDVRNVHPRRRLLVVSRQAVPLRLLSVCRSGPLPLCLLDGGLRLGPLFKGIPERVEGAVGKALLRQPVFVDAGLRRRPLLGGRLALLHGFLPLGLQPIEALVLVALQGRHPVGKGVVRPLGFRPLLLGSFQGKGLLQRVVPPRRRLGLGVLPPELLEGSFFSLEIAVDRPGFVHAATGLLQGSCLTEAPLRVVAEAEGLGGARHVVPALRFLHDGRGQVPLRVLGRGEQVVEGHVVPVPVPRRRHRRPGRPRAVLLILHTAALHVDPPRNPVEPKRPLNDGMRPVVDLRPQQHREGPGERRLARPVRARNYGHIRVERLDLQPKVPAVHAGDGETVDV